MANALCAQMPPVFITGWGAWNIASSGQVQRAKLREREELTSRLVVGASGFSAGLQGDHAEDLRHLTIATSLWPQIHRFLLHFKWQVWVPLGPALLKRV